MKMGVLGGTFDPIHVGHLAAAEAAVDCAHLDRVLFVPTAQPPHRPAAIAPAEDRLEMCRLAVAGDERFECSDIELKRPGRSYTADTLDGLRRLHPDVDLFVILGWDAARLFRSWHRPQHVRELATIVVVARPGAGSPKDADLKTVGLDGPGVIVCLNRTPAVSASEIRNDIAAGRPIAGQVPEPVAEYIASHRPYAG